MDGRCLHITTHVRESDLLAIHRFRHGLMTVLAIKERPGVLVNLPQPAGVITFPRTPRARGRGTTGQTVVEWEEVRLMAWRTEIPMPAGGLFSAQSRSSPPGRGRRHNPSHEGKAARGCGSSRSAYCEGRSRGGSSCRLLGRLLDRLVSRQLYL
jgi:hypothetical protein